MPITQYYVNPAIDADSGTGTIGDPFGDLQYALNTVTRDTTNGDQFNIKAGTAEMLTAALTLATYGTPTYAAPLILRGYTSVANDGGQGVLDCGGKAFGIMASRYANVAYINLRMRNVGVSVIDILVLGASSLVLSCEIDTNPHTIGIGINANSNTVIAGCYIHDCNRLIQTAYGMATYINNYLVVPVAGYGIYNNGTGGDVICGNIVLCSNAGAYGYFCNSPTTSQNISGNIFYNSAAGTTAGILLNNNATGNDQKVLNNIVIGWSGVGGTGIKHAGRPGLVGHNAFYNNTINESYGLAPLGYLGGNVTLAANPFTDAAHGDFSLTTAGKAALTDKGFPTQFLGVHANTDPHITIGAIQQALATGGGFPKIASVLGRTRM